ncbi:MAG: hypothetical protein WBV85_01690 [Solirubrobacteraceae bacterium]
MSTAGWMRSQRDRPIAEHERRAAMAVVVVLLGAVALLFTLTQPASQAHRATQHSDREALGSQAADNPSALTPEARETAELFLAGYLGYAYGHTTPSKIKDASPSLIRSLENRPPRVPPAARARRPRVISLRATAAPAGEIAVSATVNDGGLIDYTVGLTLTRQGGRLLVTGLDGA